MSDLTEAFRRDGYAVVDGFLPEAAADELFDLYEKAAWEEIDQSRPEHYRHVFKTGNPRLPREDESYLARFDRSRETESSPRMTESFREFFIPALEKATRRRVTQADVRCYRLRPGHFYRTHIDDYAGALGLVYYLNKRWSWDWGGILSVADGAREERLDCVYPAFNRAVLLDHETFRLPHFISPVTRYALNPRYTVVAFCR